MTKLHLTMKDILSKRFRTGFKGYNTNDVDSFLDLIIKDYNIFQQNQKKLQSEENEVTPLKQDNQSLRQENASLKSDYNQIQSDSKGRIEALQDEIVQLKRHPATHTVYRTKTVYKAKPQATSVHKSAPQKLSWKSVAHRNPKLAKILFRLERLENAVYGHPQNNQNI